MIKNFLKSYRDKNLLPIREQIYDLIYKNSQVVDFGCGDGELLKILSPKISYGLGIDCNKERVQIAKINCNGSKNLEIEITDASEKLEKKFDYSILMFVLHSLNDGSQKKVLDNARENSDKLIIVDYDVLVKRKLLIHADEILAGHYGNFKDYLRKKGVGNLVGENSFEKFNTCKDYVKIWELK